MNKCTHITRTCDRIIAITSVTSHIQTWTHKYSSEYFQTVANSHRRGSTHWMFLTYVLKNWLQSLMNLQFNDAAKWVSNKLQHTFAKNVGFNYLFGYQRAQISLFLWSAVKSPAHTPRAWAIGWIYRLSAIGRAANLVDCHLENSIW